MADDPFVTSQQQHTQHIYRPIPRRNFIIPSSLESDLEPPSQDPLQPESQSQPQPPIDEPPDELWPQNTPPSYANSHHRSSDFLAQLNARLLRSTYGSHNPYFPDHVDNGAPSRNKSYLNMTSSTLYGIYDDAGSNSGTAGEGSVADTPGGMGAETPARHYSYDSNYSYGTGYGNGWENNMGSPDGGLTMRTKQRSRRGTVADIRTRHGRDSRLLKQSTKAPRNGISRFAVTIGKLAALFVFGVAYGVIISHLHDSREIAAYSVDVIVDRDSWIYVTSWGLFGILLGSLLPYLDIVWSGEPASADLTPESDDDNEKCSESSLGEQWNEVVRSVGAFVGIAFAIRRLPWQSTLQLTLTLALVNPALWYILDRSKLGFSFSLITTSILTSFIFLSNPDVLPSPALPALTNATGVPSPIRSSASSSPYGGNSRTSPTDAQLFAGLVSYDNLATVTWVGSVIFCSCVCFGGIGRRLAVLEGFPSSSSSSLPPSRR
ncbi:hypothetical protein BU24DRAFT_242539 [Aaosphaeria arxii CBS 175.79]|uniref:INSIG-domain-containing protein n=1 Tax=Aaosphaeria arxii CBS 175.79 TaxID=1450172 RepID=A0A6A5XKK4_9PLEO|nr:uncharacterized protein BU24DRAFT_242539 [Aaosphaeria arxii CBS 175.79]KAF2013662.1 hypothetical protein BU24DRAFT_242539 [Aaosphaeria arxii CBS 175.79]